jgi:serine/threonine protein phosphatase PrpC
MNGARVQTDSLKAGRIVCSTRIDEARRGRGQDRVRLLALERGLFAVIADGAGGLVGGAAAADAICHALVYADSSNREDWLTRRDQMLAGSSSTGCAAAVVVSISEDGTIDGASVGDCEAWIFGQGGPIELTESQHRKPLLGTGAAAPVRFTAHLSNGTLLVASDGLWKYMKHAAIAGMAVIRPLEAAVAALVDGVRLRSGALQDDVAVMICSLEDAR